MSLCVSFFRGQNGATATEYALIAALVALAGILAFTATGNTILSTWTEVADDFCTALGGSFTLTTSGAESCTL